MNSQIKTVTIIAALSIVSIGFITASGVTTSMFLTPSANTAQEEGGFMGHIALSVYDSDGNIKMYRQTDNQIMNQGENCVIEVLFGATSAGSQPCGTAATFDKIAVGTGATSVTSADTILSSESARAAGSLGTTTSSSGTGTTSSAQVVSHTFTAGAGGLNLRESGLFDSTGTDGGNLFARQTFGTVPLNSGDTITVDWTITVGPN